MSVLPLHSGSWGWNISVAAQSQLLSVSNNTGGLGDTQGSREASEWNLQLWKEAGKPLVVEMTGVMQGWRLHASQLLQAFLGGLFQPCSEPSVCISLVQLS